MKSIELTEEHKSKLLEMCKKLFPEYLLIDIHKNGLLVLWEELPPSRMWHEIHWFEFCMTHLFYALYDDWRKEDINCVTDFHLDTHNYYLKDFVNNKGIHKNYEKYHPINYLHNKFKELQKSGYEF